MKEALEMQFTHFTATLWTPLLYQERSMCFMAHQAVFLSASWLYHKCFIPRFLNKHLRDESVEMSIQRNMFFLEDSLDFERSILHQLVPLGLIKQAQSSIMSHISHPLQFIFATLGIIDCPPISQNVTHCWHQPKIAK